MTHQFNKTIFFFISTGYLTILICGILYSVSSICFVSDVRISAGTWWVNNTNFDVVSTNLVVNPSVNNKVCSDLSEYPCENIAEFAKQNGTKHIQPSVILDVLLTSGLHSWTIDLYSTGIKSRIHLHPCRELRHCMSSVFDSDGVHSVERRDVGDRISSIAVILDMNLCLCSWIWNNLDGQLRLPCFRAVHRERRCFIDLSSLQPWSTSGNLAFLFVLFYCEHLCGSLLGVLKG